MAVGRRIGVLAASLACALGLLGAIGTSAALAGPATHFLIQTPASATAGTAFSFTVTAKDALNNTATGYTGTVHFTASDGQAVLPADSTLVNGVGTFAATFKTAGSQTITGTDTVTTSIAGTSNSTSVSAAAATHFAVSAPSSATAGTPFNFTITAQDQFNNTATSYAGTVHFTASDGQAVLPANTTLTNGTRNLSATLKTAGNQTITGTDTITPSITGTSLSIAVSPAAATHFFVSAPASATAGTAFFFTLTAADQFNNTATGYGGTVHFTSSDGQAVLPANSTLTHGVGTFSATLKTAGLQTITATDTVSSGVTGTSNSIAVFAAAATHFAVSGPASATAGTAFSFTVTAQDQFNNTATSYAGTVHFTASDGQAVLPANSTLTNGSGTFSATLKTAGLQTITATDTVHTSITGTSNAISVAPAAATHFAVSAPSQAAVGQPFSFTVTALDQFNNVATGYAGHVQFSSTTDGAASLPGTMTLGSGVGTFSATFNTVGSETIKVTDTVTASITGTSNAVNVGPAPTHFTLSGPSSVTAGTAFSVTVTARDATNAVVPGYTGTVHFSTGDGQALLPADTTLVNGTGTFSATLKTAGSQAIAVRDAGTASITPATLSIPVSPAVTSRFVVAAPASTTAGVALTFTVAAQDAFGNSTPTYAGTVHFSSSDGGASLPADSTLTNGAGSFTATLKTAGARTITGTDTSSSSTTGTSNTINVAPAAASRLALSAPSTATAGRAFTATVTARDQFGNTATGYGGTVRFTSNDSLATLPASARLTGGTGAFTITLRTAGSRTVTATDTASRSLTAGATVSVHGTFLPTFIVGHGKKTTLGKSRTFTVPGVSVRCPSGAPRGCKLTGSALRTAGKARDARRRVAKPLATVSMTLRGGATQKISMKLSQAGLSALRAAGTLRLTVKLTASVVGGKGTTLTRTFTLQPRRLRHR
jgi:hypothetical protein